MSQAELGFLRDSGELGLQPGFQCGDDGGGLRAPGSQAGCRILAADGLLDPVEGRDPAQHLLGDGGSFVLEALDDAAAVASGCGRRRCAIGSSHDGDGPSDHWRRVQQWTSCHGPVSRATSVSAS